MYPAADVVERLEGGTIDLLVAPAREGHGALMARALFADAFLTAQRKGRPRGTAPPDLDGFCALDHLIVSTEGGSFSGVVDRSLAALGRTRRVALSIQSYSLAPIIVAASEYVCTLPIRLLRRHAANLDLFEPPLTLREPQLVALWHARNQEDQGHIWLRERLSRAADAAL